jgi:hypothetical protein
MLRGELMVPTIGKDPRCESLRFLATAGEYGGLAELTSSARRAEEVGCSAFVVPRYLIGQYAAMPLLAVVAAATERVRVGTCALNARCAIRPCWPRTWPRSRCRPAVAWRSACDG